MKDLMRDSKRWEAGERMSYAKDGDFSDMIEYEMLGSQIFKKVEKLYIAGVLTDRRRKPLRIKKMVKTRSPETVTVDIDAIPDYQSDNMCRELIGCVRRLFEDPEVAADYKRWQQERQRREGLQTKC